MSKPLVKELVAAVGISSTYASDILSGKQDPSFPLAATIFRKTGWRHDLVRDLTDAALNEIADKMEWSPPAKKVQAA